MEKEPQKKERKELISLVQEYRDVFAFTYDELKAYKEDVVQHTIPLRDDTKSFQQKLRRINPKLAPLVQVELKKVLDVGIISPTRHSSWCSNLVVVRKKNGGIRLCIDFRNLNLACIKDNYPLPNMETLLQRVIGSKIMSWFILLSVSLKCHYALSIMNYMSLSLLNVLYSSVLLY